MRWAWELGSGQAGPPLIHHEELLFVSGTLARNEYEEVAKSQRADKMRIIDALAMLWRSNILTAEVIGFLSGLHNVLPPSNRAARLSIIWV